MHTYRADYRLSGSCTQMTRCRHFVFLKLIVMAMLARSNHDLGASRLSIAKSIKRNLLFMLFVSSNDAVPSILLRYGLFVLLLVKRINGMFMIVDHSLRVSCL